MQERPFAATYRPESATLVVVGGIDELSIDAFRDRLAAARTEPAGLEVLDLSEVDYFPSVAVNALVGVLAPGGDVSPPAVLAAEGTAAQRVLAMCGLPHRTA